MIWKKQELAWTRMEPPTKEVVGQKFEYAGRIVKVVDYDPEGIPTITVSYLVWETLRKRVSQWLT